MNKFLYLFLALLTSQSFSGPIKVINIESNSQSLKEEIYRSFPQKTGEQFNFNVINEFIKEKSRDRKFKKLSFEYDHKSQSLTFKVSSHPKLDSQTFDIGKSFPDYSKIKIELEENTSFVYGSYIDRESIRQKKDSIRSLLSSQGYIIDRISHEISLVPERENWSRLRFNIEIAGVESTQAIRLQGFSKDSATELVQLLNEREFLKTDSQHFFKNEGGKNEFVSKFSSQLNIKLLNNILEEFSAQKRKEGFLNYGLESYVDEYENYNELVLKQNKGKYFNLQFRGNVAIWENQLRDRLMTKILSLNLSYNNSESVKLIENEYKKLGYKNVVVKSESTNSQETNNISVSYTHLTLPTNDRV